MEKNKTTFQFISEPQDVNYGGNVHGGMVMKWIDQAAYACAGKWAENYCVTVYVGGIRFYKPIGIGEIVRLESKVIYTGNTSIHIAVDVFSRDVTKKDFEKTTHCVIVFVAIGKDKKPTKVPKWNPKTVDEKKMESYAIRLMELRKDIENEMKPFIAE